MKYVYIFKIGDYYKIGFTANLKRRSRSFTFLPFDIRILCIIETDEPRKIEKELHLMFTYKNKTGEWFELNDHDLNKIYKNYKCIVGDEQIEKHLTKVKTEPTKARKRIAKIELNKEDIILKTTSGICPDCNKPFTLRRNDAVYCSDYCRVKAFRKRNRQQKLSESSV
jgi:hypothetical protein